MEIVDKNMTNTVLGHKCCNFLCLFVFHFCKTIFVKIVFLYINILKNDKTWDHPHFSVHVQENNVKSNIKSLYTTKHCKKKKKRLDE